MDIRFCFLISEKAEMSYDIDTGEPRATLAQITLEDAKHWPDDYDAMHQKYAEWVAKTSGIPVEWVKLITPEEHDRDKSDDEESVGVEI